MQKREASFTIAFNTWLRTVHKETGAYELKHTRGSLSFPFREVQEHQINALLAAKHGTLVHKLSDAGMVYLPFDVFCLSGVPSYIVIKYPSGVAYGIDIDAFLRERDTSKRKSLTEDRARDISSFSF